METVQEDLNILWNKFIGHTETLDQNIIESMSKDNGRNVELKCLLLDEKQRCEQHLTNFETSKNENSKLEAQNISLRKQIETMCKDNENLKQTYENMLCNTRQEMRTMKEDFTKKNKDYKQNLEESNAKYHILEHTFHLQVKDLNEQLANATSRVSQHAQWVYMKEDELKWAKEQSAVYMRGTEENFKTKLVQIRKEAQQVVKKTTDELHVEVTKALDMSKEKTSLQLQVKSLLDEVQQVTQEKQTLTRQLAAMETEQKKTLMEQRVMITTVQGEKKLLETRLEDRVRLCDQLKQENKKLQTEINAHKTELKVANSRAQSITNQLQAELHLAQMRVNTLKNAITRQEEMFRKYTQNEQAAQGKIITDLLHQIEQLTQANIELNKYAKTILSTSDATIEKLELEITRLETNLSEKEGEREHLKQLVRNKQNECTKLKSQLSTSRENHEELRAMMKEYQELIEKYNPNEEFTQLLSKKSDQDNMQMNTLTKLFETNTEICKNLKTQLMSEKEETKRLIDEMSKYEDSRHCNHKEEMLYLSSKIRDLKLQLRAEKEKHTTQNYEVQQASNYGILS